MAHVRTFALHRTTRPPTPDEHHRLMGRPTSIYGLDRGDSSPRLLNEPDVGDRALEEPLNHGAMKSDDVEMGTPTKASSPTSIENKFANKKSTKKPAFGMLLVGPAVMQVIGVGAAWAILSYGASAAYTEKISDVAALGLHWIYAAAGLLAFTVRLVNFYPMPYKSLIASELSTAPLLPQTPGAKGAIDAVGRNLRSNPFIYKTLGGESVIFDNDGHVGMYNRANRSLQHMVENIPSVLVGLILAGYVFPFPTFVCVAVFCLGRIVHQIGYTGGYGGHGAGFGLVALSSIIIEGLMIIVPLAAAGLVPGPIVM